MTTWRFPNLRKAFEVHDSTHQPRINALWDAVLEAKTPTVEAAMRARDKAEAAADLALQLAFFEDCKLRDIPNSLDHCKLLRADRLRGFAGAIHFDAVAKKD